ncbi:ranBP-type and C3HC4-type zinc finger-containing protein 1-like isoform X2 [Antedon mediterranea]|uniref:ranBP-type and C3HC4-type zinc finger-containing protein 1-like isoform X2 n=1 Tax=Antedon mediterranea TaxID=105859 RepID=UPI003AF7B612
MLDEEYSVLGSAPGVLYLNHDAKGWIRIAPCVLQFLDVSKGFVLKAVHDKSVLLYSPMSSLSFKVVSGSVHEFILPDKKQYQMEYEKVTDASNFGTLLGNATHEQRKSAFERSHVEMAAQRHISGGDSSSGKGELLDSLAKELMVSINEGDQQKAGEIAKRLAQEKACLAVSQSANTTNITKTDNRINLRISVEDRFKSSIKITLKVKPSISIKSLKEKMHTDYNFPPEVQRWIVGHRIVRDDETLQALSIDQSGYMVFLYLTQKEEAPRNAIQNPVAENLIDDSIQVASSLASVRPKPAPRPGFQPRRQHVPFENVQKVVRDVMQNKEPVLPSALGKKSALDVGWHCEVCTMVNAPRRPSCHMCTNPRPDNYVLPPIGSYELDAVEKRLIEEEKQHEDVIKQIKEADRQAAVLNFERLQEYDQLDVIPNNEAFTCLICYDDFDAGEGITLRECLHSFCKDCLTGHISVCEEPEIKCPFQDNEFSCEALIQDREIRALVDNEQYQKHLQRCLATAETQAGNSFHCKTVDCHGWCIYEDDVNFFPCPICGKSNCLTCKAIHEGMNCKEYQDSLQINAMNDKAAKQTQLMLDEMVRNGDAMHCPKCKIIVQKKDGCDWVRCTMCKTEICWVTKGPRWGPNGRGDKSGGCHCRENGRLCRPNCQNCH